MTRLKRITNKIFGNTASTTGSSDTGPEIGQFGSAKAGTYNATADVETIQALPAYEQGWIGAVIPDQQYPTLPEMTGVNKVLSYQTGYLMQEGIPEWDSGTTYYKNSIVKYATVTTTQTTTASIGASTGITSASVNKNTFVSQISVDGNYTFTYNGTSWLYNGIATDLNIYGITYTGTPAENDAITVTLTTTTSIGDLTLYISLTDDNINHNPLTDTTYWKEFGLGGGSGLELCDIGMALYVDETKGLRRYLNGQIVDINTNTQAFLNRLKDITTLHPSLLCTEEEWQSAKTMSAFGQVGKFVFNYSGDEIVSVRLPRVVNVQGLFDLQNLGMTVSAGLPNITGKFGTGNYNGTWFGGLDLQADGCFRNDIPCPNPNQFLLGDTRGSNTKAFAFDASRSNSIYGNSDTVQQEAIQYPYFIQIATGSETENNIINDIELNNPYSLFDSKYSDHELNNLSWLKSSGQWDAKAVYTDAYDKLLKVQNGTETVEGLSVKLSTETYTDYDFVLNTADETFRLPLKTLHSDDTVVSLSLYFYVGETVQNANLIDAGRIGEQLANKQDKLSRYPIEISNKSLMPSWYVVYNDGWCEQGGYVTGTNNTEITTTFLKKFISIPNVSVNFGWDNVSMNQEALYTYIAARNITTQNFIITVTNLAPLGTSWKACGYIS